MAFAGEFNAAGIAAEEGFNIIKMLQNCRLVTLALIYFIPLVVIMKNERNKIIKVYDETIVRSVVDELMESFVEIGEIMILLGDIPQKPPVLSFDFLQHGPGF